MAATRSTTTRNRPSDPAYITNHVELAEPYERMIFRYLPRARWFARQTYDCGGAHIPAQYLHPRDARSGNVQEQESPHARLPALCRDRCACRAGPCRTCGCTTSTSPTANTSKRSAYPAVRDVAVFYAELHGPVPGRRRGQGVVGPTFCPEHRGLGERNCTADLAFFRYTFQAAIEGATVLGCDAAPGRAVPQGPGPAARLPHHRRAAADGHRRPGQAVPIDYNIAVPVLPVFPGDVGYLVLDPRPRRGSSRGRSSGCSGTATTRRSS